jgi:hypothetical protein
VVFDTINPATGASARPSRIADRSSSERSGESLTSSGRAAAASVTASTMLRSVAGAWS